MNVIPVPVALNPRVTCEQPAVILMILEALRTYLEGRVRPYLALLNIPASDLTTPEDQFLNTSLFTPPGILEQLHQSVLTILRLIHEGAPFPVPVSERLAPVQVVCTDAFLIRFAMQDLETSLARTLLSPLAPNALRVTPRRLAEWLMLVNNALRHIERRSVTMTPVRTAAASTLGLGGSGTAQTPAAQLALMQMALMQMAMNQAAALALMRPLGL